MGRLANKHILQGPVLIFGATGRHGGTGARVIERLKAAGRSVRAVVRTDDERAEQLRQSGVRTMVGNMHDRRTLVPALEGVSSVYVAYPVAAGVALALANVASVIHELDSSPHVVVIRMARSLSIARAESLESLPSAKSCWCASG